MLIGSLSILKTLFLKSIHIVILKQNGTGQDIFSFKDVFEKCYFLDSFFKKLRFKSQGTNVRTDK